VFNNRGRNWQFRGGEEFTPEAEEENWITEGGQGWVSEPLDQGDFILRLIVVNDG
jgi:hypothetical protein